MDYDKNNLDELFHYGNKILAELETAANEKAAALESTKSRYKALREGLQTILNNANIEEEKF